MSLTTFLEQNADVRRRFLVQFKKPEFRQRLALLAPPLTMHYGIAGTAFDYLLRFYVQKLNSDSSPGEWVAEKAPRKILSYSDAKTFVKAAELLSRAQKRHRAFLRSKTIQLPVELIEDAIGLAYMDAVFRVGLIDTKMFARPSRFLVRDLQAMLSLIPKMPFQARRRLILNPTFGSGSELVGGADADLIVDDTLIDVKTSKHLVFDRSIFNQLVGYYVLLCLGGIDGHRKAEINHLAIYYARYGLFHSVAVADCVSQSDLPAFLNWFTARAKKAYPRPK